MPEQGESCDHPTTLSVTSDRPAFDRHVEGLQYSSTVFCGTSSGLLIGRRSKRQSEGLVYFLFVPDSRHNLVDRSVV